MQKKKKNDPPKPRVWNGIPIPATWMALEYRIKEEAKEEHQIIGELGEQCKRKYIDRLNREIPKFPSSWKK